MFPSYIVNFVCISQSFPKVDHDLLSEYVIESLGANLVSEHPPGDRHHPHDDEDHGDDVIDEVAAELAQTACFVVTTLHLLRDVGHHPVESDPHQQQQPNTNSA